MSTVECATEGVSTWQKWLGALAMLSAAVSVVTFLVFFSVTAEFSKALVYGGDPLTMLYLSAPTISTVTGAASIPLPSWRSGARGAR